MFFYNENTVMTFGRYKNYKLGNVPASHLLWLYNKAAFVPEPLKKYIEQNMEKLKQQKKAAKSLNKK